jgi:Sulfotransferase domain
MTKPICLWSGPRNVSTALMYSFAQLKNVRVVDEPLYGHYLRVSGALHPGRQQVIDAMDCDGDKVIGGLLKKQTENPSVVLFIKHMAHHLVDLDLGFLKATNNVFLVRDPYEMLPSLTVQLPHATLTDTGLQQQWQLFSELSAHGQRPAVLDSRELLLNPERILRALCAHLELEFDVGMLSWETGGRPEDGVWAPHWYHAVHQSTGFAPYSAKLKFPEHLQTLLDDCNPYYEKLYAHAFRADTPGD